MDAPQHRLLDDGKRLHLHHGPIDLVISAVGSDDEIARAYDQARDRFQDVLPVLVDELVMLRTPLSDPPWKPNGPVAKRMVDVVWRHEGIFVTPMAAVAGAVSDEMLAATIKGRDLDSCWVNNSGDIAFHLAPGASLTLGVVGSLFRLAVDGTATFTHDMTVRGIATSGWAGRSHSLGIADAVTVLATDAATADVAATLIANDVDVDHPAIVRKPADEVDDDTDLGDRMVTVSVGTLDGGSIRAALDLGVMAAETLRAAGRIEAAMLILRNQTRVVGDMPSSARQ
jgi:ApbE superfamily uncharacterized protein (UPF0280 family)